MNGCVKDIALQRMANVLSEYSFQNMKSFSYLWLIQNWVKQSDTCDAEKANLLVAASLHFYKTQRVL